MVILDERADLRGDGGSIKAHHKKLPHLPVGTEREAKVSDNPRHINIAKRTHRHPDYTVVS